MIFWVAVAVMAAVVTFVITRPLMRGNPSDDHAQPSDADIAVYRHQLEEIETDRARGTLKDAEAEEAKTEIARRILRADLGRSANKNSDDSVSKPDAQDAPRLATSLYFALSAGIPVGALALYLLIGTPGLPGQPLADRLAQPVDLSDTESIIARIEYELRKNSDDGRGWDAIAPVYAARGRFDDAAQAYAQASKLLGSSVRRSLGFAVSRMRSDNGVINDDARMALKDALLRDPDNIEARFWIVLAKEQNGATNEAISDYKALLSDAPSDAPWRKAVVSRLNVLGEDVTDAATGASPEKKSQAARGEEGSSKSRQTTQGKMVESMVSRLAARMEKQPDDVDGWRMLIRFYHIMGRRDDAKKAVAEARKVFAEKPEERKSIEVLAAELKLSG